MRKMKPAIMLLPVIAVGLLLTSFYQQPNSPPPDSLFPYEAAGLSEREAAAHLVSRFSFGARPGELEQIVAKGLEPWFQDQLQGKLDETVINKKLLNYSSLTLSNAQIVQTYPRPAQALAGAIKSGVVKKEDVNKEDRDAYRKVLGKYMTEQGLKPQAELLKELVAQKILRAAYAQNQLHEVMTDFWFNHFNVAASKGGIQQFITSYERDVIRPNVVGGFETLLLATAKSPAMLVYLDNARSSAVQDMNALPQRRASNDRTAKRGLQADSPGVRVIAQPVRKPQQRGLNENYAREVMELHTMGVDGGYTQSDVTAAARILTGWSLNPSIEYKAARNNNINRQLLESRGLVYDDNFLFLPQRHDKQEKTWMGHRFPAGSGHEEGLQLLHLLATHAATANFICKKIAIRFVSDTPPPALVKNMAAVFSKTQGNIASVLLAMVQSPEFWQRGALRQKTKSPFELAISTLRSTDAEVITPYPLYQWISKMGQKMYNYTAPTGFPDRGDYWINTGSLLNRMNFGLALASGRIPGIRVNLLDLNNNHEPESAEAALKIYSHLLLPERNVNETMQRLLPLLGDPAFETAVESAANAVAKGDTANDEEMMMDESNIGMKRKKENKRNSADQGQVRNNNPMLAQVVGIIIGSPEYQRR